MAGAIVSAKDIGGVFESLALYIGTCITGLIIHSFVVYPLLYFIFTRKNPLKFFSGMIEPAITAFGTSSRYVCTTLPIDHLCGPSTEYFRYILLFNFRSNEKLCRSMEILD